MSSTSFPASVDSASDSKEPECELSPSARLIAIAKRFSSDVGRPPQSTGTCENSQLNTLQQTELELTSSAEASPVKTCPEPDTVVASLAKDRDCGETSAGSLANYDPATQSWRTSQRCLIEKWEPFLGTWPQSGMTRSGQLFPLAPLVRHTCDSECSLWPTPTASMDGRGFGIPLHERTGRYRKSTVLRVHALVGAHGWRIHPNFTETLMGLPLGWTEIEPSETPSSPQSQNSLGGK